MQVGQISLLPCSKYAFGMALSSLKDCESPKTCNPPCSHLRGHVPTSVCCRPSTETVPVPPSLRAKRNRTSCCLSAQFTSPPAALQGKHGLLQSSAAACLLECVGTHLVVMQFIGCPEGKRGLVCDPTLTAHLLPPVCGLPPAVFAGL
jgi:hypothetical protein